MLHTRCKNVSNTLVSRAIFVNVVMALLALGTAPVGNGEDTLRVGGRAAIEPHLSHLRLHFTLFVV